MSMHGFLLENLFLRLKFALLLLNPNSIHKLISQLLFLLQKPQRLIRQLADNPAFLAEFVLVHLANFCQFGDAHLGQIRGFAVRVPQVFHLFQERDDDADFLLFGEVEDCVREVLEEEIR